MRASKPYKLLTAYMNLYKSNARWYDSFAGYLLSFVNVDITIKEYALKTKLGIAIYANF